MAGEVRLREDADAGDAAGVGKLMPLWQLARVQIDVAHHPCEEGLQGREIDQPIRCAPIGLDNPFDTRHRLSGLAPRILAVLDSPPAMLFGEYTVKVRATGRCVR